MSFLQILRGFLAFTTWTVSNRNLHQRQKQILPTNDIESFVRFAFKVNVCIEYLHPRTSTKAHFHWQSFFCKNLRKQKQLTDLPLATLVDTTLFVSHFYVTGSFANTKPLLMQILIPLAYTEVDIIYVNKTIYLRYLSFVTFVT